MRNIGKMTWNEIARRRERKREKKFDGDQMIHTIQTHTLERC